MATSNAVWGIDIGQCALKALRCSANSDGTVQAEAFDFIEYPKILSQPDANPEALVKDALKEFLSRNSLRDGKVAISVSGQSGLARFIKLPPVEAKKIPDIVKYEAKQQIPFALEDVIWDYQPLLGGIQEEGVALETEVGLFAMKRDQVFRTIRPFRDAGIELDIVQLTPLAIYNAVTYGVMEDIPPVSEYDPDNPPKSVVVISMGTDTTDLVVTNGYKIWQRSVPIGGSHFTKQLTKEMKLTFAKAEHLKRHAREAEDPKAVFQAMRSVFNLMVQEFQRSIGFFQSIDRSAEIDRIVVLGNTVRLPGLQPYLEKNLGYKVTAIDAYKNLTGSEVISQPAFKDNILSFAVAYGLALQGLNKAKLATNLIPRELITARVIRRKKPWALAGLSILLAGFAGNYLLNWARWSSVIPARYETQYSKISRVQGESTQWVSTDDANKERFALLKSLGDSIVGNADSRMLVLELYKAINESLPREEADDLEAISQLPVMERPQLYIESVESEFFPQIEEYFTTDVEERYREFRNELAASQAADAATMTGEDDADDADAEDESEEDSAEEITFDAPSGPGWVIQLKGHHFHNNDVSNQGAAYVRNTLLNNLEFGDVELPSGPGQPPLRFQMKELGIQFPILATDNRIGSRRIENPDYVPPRKSPQNFADPSEIPSGPPPQINVPSFDFVVQFIWQEKRVSERLEARKENANAGTTDDVAGR